jgi:sugar phosphate isomerase/epimerase
MSIVFGPVDIESAATELIAVGLEGIEIFCGHLPQGSDSPALARIDAVRNTIQEAGLVISSLNFVADRRFDVLDTAGGWRESGRALADQLVVANALLCPRVMVWEGVADVDNVKRAPGLLADAIEFAKDSSHLSEPPPVVVEPHPFTWSLQHDRLSELAAVTMRCGGGIAIDFSHFAVALGPDFFDRIAPDVMEAITHVHFCDSDCTTPEFHLPPGRGLLDLKTIGARFRSRNLTSAWDLYGWPAPRAAMRKHLGAYQAFVNLLGAS